MCYLFICFVLQCGFCYIAQVDFEIKNPPVSAFHILELQVCSHQTRLMLNLLILNVLTHLHLWFCFAYFCHEDVAQWLEQEMPGGYWGKLCHPSNCRGNKVTLAIV